MQIMCPPGPDGYDFLTGLISSARTAMIMPRLLWFSGRLQAPSCASIFRARSRLACGKRGVSIAFAVWKTAAGRRAPIAKLTIRPVG